MRHTSAWLTLILACLLLLGGCATTPRDIQRPELNLAGIEIQELGVFQQRYVITLRASNPNAIALPVQGVRYKIELEGQDFASGMSSAPFRIPAYGEEDIQVELSTNLIRTGQWLLDKLRAGDMTLDYRISGDIDVGLGRIGRLPFDESGQVDLRFDNNQP
ncbi:hypothetical protein CAI21_20320 [Alkalilimnicola ehrlichii]|uniref:Water stress and hypersensitive response domain-containing protein n=1 Tax=Alkalilimnicola ehrlichii TaxID=351052 RepID=A0A3E0WGK6_9GAMM|nr:LEA type 2 family protein [Alkalilimnicola ehrlichii]RFA24755.1 hypothetical protein CAI21_20320 [Alkalilimnicola ehrlichii]RFA32014.1 hypothetical protein CAL65_20910 [Alkalilimnicola ehrlichii]